MLYWLNRVLLGRLFRLQIRGNLPDSAGLPFILAPNHTSSLDAFIVAASLPWKTVRQTRWAGRQGVVLQSPVHRFVNWIAGVVPIRRNGSALATAHQVLDQGEHLVWFPEGTRSKTGDLQAFKPGIVNIMRDQQRPVVPILIQGAHEAMPPGRKWPALFARITVRFGEPVSYGDLQLTSSEPQEPQQQAQQLQERWIKLRSWK